MTGFIKLMRSPEAMEIVKDGPTCQLLMLIALRAQREAGFVYVKGVKTWLEAGESFIGDYKTLNMNEGTYRGAKSKLAANGLVTFKGTNKGTVARLINSSVYNINCIDGNGQDNGHLTDVERTINGQLTTNKNLKKEKNNTYAPLSEFLKDKIVQNGTSGIIKDGQLENWSNAFRLMVEQDGRTEDQIWNIIEAVFKDAFWSKNIRSAETLREKWNKGKLDGLKSVITPEEKPKYSNKDLMKIFDQQRGAA